MGHAAFTGRLVRSFVCVRYVGLLLLLLALPSFGEAARTTRACRAEPTDEVISYGDAITCQMNAVADSDTFRFAGTANERIIVLATRTGGSAALEPCIEVSGPDGMRIATGCASFTTLNRVDLTLTRTGTHTILIRDDNNTDTGTYSLVLERVSPLSQFGTTIRYGETLSDQTVDIVGDLKFFLFGGAKDSRITIQTARTAGAAALEPCIELWGPDGVRISSACASFTTQNRIDATLTRDGTHTLLVRDDNYTETGTYSITLQCISGSCTDAIPTSLNAAVSPPSLSAAVGAPAVASATITNTGSSAATAGEGEMADTADTAPADALSCGIVQLTGLPTQFSYQATNPTTGQLIGSANTPANILPGQSQSFQVSLTPTAPFCPTNVTFGFSCSNAAFADVLTGVNTVLLTGGTPASCGLRASATVNRPTFAVGQTLVAGAAATNSGLAGTAADVYVGVLRPDQSIEFLTSGGIVVGNAANPGSFRPLVVNVSLAAPFSASQPNVLTRVRAAGDAPGAYVFFVAATRTGTLELLSIATAPYTFP